MFRFRHALMVKDACNTCRWFLIHICLFSGYRCPCNWKYFDRRCYFVSNHSIKNWLEARKYCRSYGGDLAVPRNPLDTRKIYETMKAKSVGTAFIGIFRAPDGLGRNNFYTVHGFAPKYTNWYAGEPNNRSAGTEDCIEMVYKARYFEGGQLDLRGGWNDAPCNGVSKVPNHFVCAIIFKKYDD